MTLAQLQRALSENIAYKALSVLIALALWFIVRDQGIEADFDFELDLKPPEGLVVTDSSIPRLRVSASGKRSSLDRLRRTARVHVVTLDEEAGAVTVRIGPDDIAMPSGVEAFDVSPRSLTVRLEPRVERRIAVRPRLVIAGGYRAKSLTVTPSAVRVSGPSSVVGSLEEVWTEVVEVGPASTSATAAIVLTHPQLTVEDAPSVRLQVDLEPAPSPTPEDGG